MTDNNNNNKYTLDPAVLDQYGGYYPDPAVKEPIAFIQSRGLGDLFIALPIAGWYRDRGATVYWPICEEFMSTMTQAAPWVRWIPLKTDRQGKFFYDSARLALKYLVPEDRIINLMQYLSSRPQDSDPDIFPILKFDQYKYAVAGVPFLQKWRLKDYITRDPEGEATVYNTVVRKPRYIVTHLQGSDKRVELDFSGVEAAVQIVNIKEGITNNALNWLKVIEGAEALYMLDSCYSNLVDQLGIPVEKTFIRRSKMDLTPVLGADWNYMSPP